jgi:hypothetical protein
MTNRHHPGLHHPNGHNPPVGGPGLRPRSEQVSAWWRRRSIVIPPETPEEWVRLAAWEMWMGAMLLVLLYFGTHMIATSPDRVITVTDLSKCYGTPPVPIPCDRVYHAGMLNVAFSAFSGFIMIAVAIWFIWELWSAAEPKPITDDFLRLLNDSFGRNWRNPLTWPWARAFWAYGFTALGAALTAAVAIGMWSLIMPESRPPFMRIDTSQSFRSH